MHANVDPNDASIKDCNRLLVARLGYQDKADIIGQPVFFVYHEDCLSDVEVAFNSFVSTGKVENVELTLKCKDGSKVPVILNVSSVKNEAGEILYSSSTWVEISELKEVQRKYVDQNEALERNNQELKQFAYITSHDLREPLRTLTSFTKLLKQKYHSQLDNDADMYLQFITESATRMDDLVQGLLSYSRLGQNRRLTTVDCQAVINAVQDDLAVSIAETEAVLEIGEMPQLNGNETEMRVLFQNLISNAIKFRQKNTAPLVKIVAHQENGHWKFSVQDNGIGIAKEHQERIFLIFQRLHTREAYERHGHWPGELPKNCSPPWR